MNRTISPEETEKLFVFCRQHFVYHYDLQVELVDHLASAIEEQWENNSEIEFEAALRNSFGKFGDTGFWKIKKQKRQELNRKYNRILWKHVIEFFGWPKVLMTLAFTLVFATLIKTVNSYIWIITPYLGLLGIISIYYQYRIFPKQFKMDKIKGKKFLLLEILKNSQFIFGATILTQIIIPILINVAKSNSLQNNYVVYTISFFIVLFSIILFGQMFYFPQKIKEDFNIQFPEFAL